MKSKLLGLSVLLVITGALLAGCGGSDNGGEEELEAQIHKLNGQVIAVKTSATKRVNKAIGQAEAAKAKTVLARTAVIGKAEKEAGKIVGAATRKAQKLAHVESEIEAKESELAGVQESLEGAQQEKALSSFGPGIQKAEVDYIPGTYESSGGNSCYWAELNSANTNDILDNEFATENGQQIVTIEAPYFQSSGCGNWKKIE